MRPPLLLVFTFGLELMTYNFDRPIPFLRTTENGAQKKKG